MQGLIISVLGTLYFGLLFGLSFIHTPLFRVVAVLPPGALVFVSGWAKVISKKKNAALDADDDLRQTASDIAEELDMDTTIVLQEIRQRFFSQGFHIPSAQLDRWLAIPDELNTDKEAPLQQKDLKQAVNATGLVKRSGPKDRKLSA